MFVAKVFEFKIIKSNQFVWTLNLLVSSTKEFSALFTKNDFMIRLFILAFSLVPMLLFAQQEKSSKKKILIALSSYGKGAGKIRPGFEFDEYSQAYLIFKANGFDVDVTSPKGGAVEADEYNKAKPYNKELLSDQTAIAKLQNTIPTSQIKPELYDAIYVVGGKGAMFDLPFDPSLQEVIQKIYEQQKGIVAAVCHGPAAFVNVKLSNGNYLITNKTLTGFCNDEELKFGKTWKDEFPFLLEDKLIKRGVKYERSYAMLPQLSIDGQIITGQNPFSTTILAEQIVRSLGLTPAKREQYKDEKSIHLVKKALAGQMDWAKEELRKNYASYDTLLIAVYGYYKLLFAKGDKLEITNGLKISELVSDWVYNEVLRYEMAKGYLVLDDKVSSKKLLNEIIVKTPSFSEAKALLDQIK